MLSPRLTNCPECANIPSLIKKIDCKLAELGNNLYNNISYMLNKSVPSNDILQLIGYRRILMYKYYNPNYVHTYSVQMIASRVIRLTAGCVSRCNEPERCLEEPCDITIVPNPTTTTSTTIQPTTTTTSSSSTSTSTSTTTSTTSTSSTTTTTTTTIASMCFYMGGETPGDLYSCTVEPEVGLINGKPYYKLLLPDCTTQWVGFDEPVYIWFSTSGDYPNTWVVSELYNATIGNVYSYISSGGSGSYPIGTWEVLTDQIFVVDSSIGDCSEFICFAIYQENVGGGNPILYIEEIPLEGNAPFQNGRPVYNIEGPFPGSLYYNGSQWVYAVEDFAPGLQPLLNSSYYPIGTYSEWGSPGVTGAMLSSILNGCPSVPA
jgi:hypothetical protein